MNFQKTWTLFNSPNGAYINGFKAYLQFHGSIQTIDKSVGGVIKMNQRNVTGVGQVQFFQGQPDIATDSNMNDFTLPQSEHMVITHLRSYDGVNAVLENTTWTPGLIAPELMNGDFSFTANGVTVLNRIPNTVFTQSPENPFSGYYEVPFPIIWKGQTEIIWQELYRTNPVLNQNQRNEVIGLGYLA